MIHFGWFSGVLCQLAVVQAQQGTRGKWQCRDAAGKAGGPAHYVPCNLFEGLDSTQLRGQVWIQLAAATCYKDRQNLELEYGSGASC